MTRTTKGYGCGLSGSYLAAFFNARILTPLLEQWVSYPKFEFERALRPIGEETSRGNRDYQCLADRFRTLGTINPNRNQQSSFNETMTTYPGWYIFVSQLTSMHIVQRNDDHLLQLVLD